MRKEKMRTALLGRFFSFCFAFFFFFKCYLSSWHQGEGQGDSAAAFTLEWPFPSVDLWPCCFNHTDIETRCFRRQLAFVVRWEGTKLRRKSLQPDKLPPRFSWQRVNRASGPVSAQQFNCCRPGKHLGERGLLLKPHFSKTCHRKLVHWMGLIHKPRSGSVSKFEQFGSYRLVSQQEFSSYWLPWSFHLLVDWFQKRYRYCTEGVCVCICVCVIAYAHMCLEQGS